MDKERLVNLSQGARAVGVDRQTVKRAVRQGLLDPVSIPGKQGRWVTVGAIQAAVRVQVERMRDRPRAGGRFAPLHPPRGDR